MSVLFQKIVSISIFISLFFTGSVLAIDMAQFMVQYKNTNDLKAKVKMIENLKQTLIEEIHKTEASENNLNELFRLVSYRNYLAELELKPYKKEKCEDIRGHIIATATGISDTNSSLPYTAKDVLEIWDGLCALPEEK